MIFWTPVVAILVFVPMLAEAARARHNEDVQRSRGGIEAQGDVYNVMRIVYPAVFLAMIAEGVWRGPSSVVATATGVAIFAAAKTLKWWAIRSLGSSWTFRVIVVPGMPLVRSGPYRFLRHPNYVAVVGELVGVWLLTSARIMGPVATLAFGALMLKRISVETRTLDAILRRG